MSGRVRSTARHPQTLECDDFVTFYGWSLKFASQTVALEMDDTLAQPEECRLSRFAAGLQEVCWLGAAFVIPLLVNPRAVELGYSPFKFGVWIMLSVIGMAAWLVRAVCLGSTRQSFYRNPLLVLLGILGLSGLMSAWLSVNRSSSIWGSPETFQGIAAWLAALALAALVSCNLRTPEQLRRLVSVMILSGFAAGLLAILQRAGFDPNHPNLLDGFRAHSTAGHAIYLAGYLLMTIPLTLWRLMESRRLTGVSRWTEVVIGTLMLSVQVIGFVCAESRGPTVGLVAMLLAYGVYLAVHSRSKRWLAALFGLFTVGVIMIGVISFAPLPENFGSKVPILKRFLQNKSSGAGFDYYRSEMWKHMPKMMVNDAPLPTPSGGSDSLHRLRLLVGYGPETLQSVLPQFMSNSSDVKIENRFHNLVWDRLFSYGILGTLSLLMVVFFTFYDGFQALGWISRRRDAVIFASTMVTCSTAGAMAAWFAMSAGFIGMGILCGVAAGAMLFAVIRAMRTPANEDAQRTETFPCGLLIALLAGLVGHLVDMVFAFHTAPTAVMFWLCIGMVHAARYLRVAGPGTVQLSLAEIVSRPLANKVPTFTLGYAALLALGVVTVLFGILHQYSHPPMTFGGILKGSLFQLNPSDGQTSLLWIMPVALLFVGGPILAVPVASAEAAGFARRALRVTLLAALIAGTFCILLTLKIRAVGSVPPPSTPMVTVLKQAMAYEGLFFTYLATAGLLLVLMAWDFARPYAAHIRVPVRGWVATGLAGIAAIFFGWQFSLRPLRANLASQWASALNELGRPDFAAVMYRRAIDLDSQPSLYRWLLATSLMGSASRSQDANVAQVSLAEAEKVLKTGLTISERNRSHMILGQLYLQRAFAESSPARDATAAHAARAFAMATTFEPHQEQPWTYASITDRLLLNDPASADKKLNHALELPSINLEVVSANYVVLGLNTPDPRLRAEFARIAILYLDRIIATSNPQSVAMAKFEKARLLLVNRGDVATVEVLLREAIPGVHPDSSWKANGILAEILMAKGDGKGALIVLKSGLKTAPERMHKPIKELILQLGGTP